MAVATPSRRTSANEPWIQSRFGRGVFAGYVLLNLAVFRFLYHSAREVGRRSLATDALAAGIALACLVVILAVIQVNHRGSGGPLVPQWGVMLVIFVGYLLAALAVTANWHPGVVHDHLLIIALSQDGLIPIIYAAYASPFIPEEELQTVRYHRRLEYLTLYIRDWWQWARLTTTLLIAFGITFVLTVVTDTGTALQALLPFITMNLMLGAFMLGVYAYYKKRTVNERIRRYIRVRATDRDGPGQRRADRQHRR